MVRKIFKGENPKLLIHVGTHGDEHDIVSLVFDAVEKYKDKLPDFIFVPEVSPSAVVARTRVNYSGKDINRIFYSDSKDMEVVENIKIMRGNRFDLMVSFHEDLPVKEYYIYDSGFKISETDAVLKHNKKLQSHGTGLLNGLDDSDDPALGYEFKDGYRRFTEKEGTPSNGMSTVWAMSEGIVKESLTPEIPGKLSIEEKRFIIDSFFSDILVDDFPK